MKSVTNRLTLAEDATVTDIYERLLEQMINSYSALTELVTSALHFRSQRYIDESQLLRSVLVDPSVGDWGAKRNVRFRAI